MFAVTFAVGFVLLALAGASCFLRTAF